MAFASDLDESSESEYEIDENQLPESGHDEDECEPEASQESQEYHGIPWSVQAQLNTDQLAQLHRNIKASAELPIPTYQKLPRSWPIRPFDVRTLPSYIQLPIHYFELFWDSSVWQVLVDNTNAYAQFKGVWSYENKDQRGSRWWKVVTLYEMRVFIALLIYIGIAGTAHIESYWTKDSNAIHKPMAFMTYFRFQQIKRYFHISSPPTSSRQPISQWHMKLEPLASLLRTKFQAFVVLSQNVSFDEMMIPFSGRSKHTLKMKNKPIKEGFKVWALCDHGYLWDFLFYSRTTGRFISSETKLFINISRNCNFRKASTFSSNTCSCFKANADASI